MGRPRWAWAPTAPRRTCAIVTRRTRARAKAQRTKEEFDKRVEMEIERMIYVFMAVLAVTLVIGLAVGGICCMSIQKYCKGKSAKRLR